VKELFHFKGHYRAGVSHSEMTHVHTHVFSRPIVGWIEVTGLQRIVDRIPETERTGDYLYYPRIQARRKGLFSVLINAFRSEVIIDRGDSIVYSEDLEQVVLSHQSGTRKLDNPFIRLAVHNVMEDGLVLLQGEISFSIWLPSLPAVPVLPEVNTVAGESVSESGWQENVGEVVIPTRPKITINPVFRAGHALGGCLGLIFSLGKWLGYGILLILMLALLSELLKTGSPDPVPEDTSERENLRTDRKRLNPEQDTLAPVHTWDYLTDHEIDWTDFESQDYLARYTTSSREFQRSSQLHQPFGNTIGYTSSLQYWNAVYSEFTQQDRLRLDSLVRIFSGIREQYRLNAAATAEMVITCVQEIPYYLVHDGSCSEASRQGGFIQEYHAARRPCLPNIIAGVQTPYEFAHTLKGDCDTRSLFAFHILSRLGIPVSVWVSEVYGHSVLGVGTGRGSHLYKAVGGSRHFPVELTAKGFRIGMISPDQAVMNNWEIALFKN